MRKSTYYKKKDRKPDHKYGRTDMSLFINYLMKAGKKSVAENVFYSALELIEKDSKQDPVKVFEKAIENASPRLEVVSRRVGGANYQIPREVRSERKFFLACQWIIEAAKS
ncbi:MAG: 30S ribosomal protein S7, partial [Candidatus Paceibacterota bacterium]